MSDFAIDFGNIALPWRILTFIVLAAATHAVVLLIKRSAIRFSRSASRLKLRKLQSLVTLLSSGAVFVLYFLLLGVILSHFGVSLAGYLASASVVGLAVAFGSQGVVQDVVTGLTLIFSDLIDVGDLVEISGQTGIVKGITMRFVQLESSLGGIVYVPNRTISNVINYPLGYVRCFLDVTLFGDAKRQSRIHDIAIRAMQDFHEQFPGALVMPPAVDGQQRLRSGKTILRLRFAVWPNRGAAIDTALRQEIVEVLRAEMPEYQPWMIAASYEIEARGTDVPPLLAWLRPLHRNGGNANVDVVGRDR